jgi:copper chaperone NosL
MKLKNLVFIISGLALLLTLLLPFEAIIFTSPQYPDKSPTIYMYHNSLKGDMQDWKVVGRYIGINVDPELPEFDNNIIGIFIATLALILILAAFLGNKMKKYASIILLLGGISIAGWAQLRLYQQGHNLDPKAPMRSVIKPFTPPLIGVTTVSKIKIYQVPHLGMLLFVLATGLTFYVTWRKTP